MQQQLRIDVLTGRQVILASERQQRPIQTRSSTSGQTDLSDDYDPFLEGNECDTPGERLALRTVNSAANEPNWLLRVVPNRYPAATQSASAATCDLYGNHDVVIECPDVRQHLVDFTVEEMSRVLFAWQARIRQLAQDSRIQSIAVFRNEGRGAGASLPHCHSQILATNFHSNQLEQRVRCSEAFSKQNGRVSSSLFDFWLESELTLGERVVAATGSFATLCPYASRVDWQTRFIPVDVPRNFQKLSKQQIVELACLLRDTAAALKSILGYVDQNLTLILPPTDQPDLFPWMLDFLPRLNRFAGFEMLTDTDIVTVAPEAAAERLREQFVKSVPPDVEKSLQPGGYHWVGADIFKNA